MSALRIFLDCLPSLCQKLSDLVEVSRSYNNNNFAFFLRHGVSLKYFGVMTIELNIHRGPKKHFLQ